MPALWTSTIPRKVTPVATVADPACAALVALWGLMKLLRTRSLWPFAGYCFLAGFAILIARGFGA